MGFRHGEEDAQGHLLESKIVLGLCEPEDLLTFGLIPEFIGRLPVVSALAELTEEDLTNVLTEPKSAIVRQFSKLMAMENVRLTITPEALRAMAQEAIRKGTGARALRSIMERLMLDVMFEIPSRNDVAEVIIDAGVVLGEKVPLVRCRHNQRAA